MIELQEDDIVVLVGPNNTGKSLALRELSESFADEYEGRVIQRTQIDRSGTEQEFLKHLRAHSKVEIRGPSIHANGYWGGFSGPLDKLWEQSWRAFAKLFCVHIATESRIADSNPVNSFDVINEQAVHPLHLLYVDDTLESSLSLYFRRAFGQDLIVDRFGGNRISLMVGSRQRPEPGESLMSRSFLSRFRANAVPLAQQGDGMRSFASVVLHLLARTDRSILLLDEPEAFLYPSQARVIGEIIATRRPTGSQLFVATHSSDVLRGLMVASPKNLRILRMQRSGWTNNIRQLARNRVQAISRDPIMNYSSVMNGAFHQRVIVAESDSDCMFYSAILGLPEVRGDQEPDVFFVHANGKDRMGTLAGAMTALGVPVQVVVDIDIVRDTEKLRTLVESLHGDWTAMETVAIGLRKAIESKKAVTGFEEIRRGLVSAVNDVEADDGDISSLRKRVDKIMRGTSPWATIKYSGEAAIPPGQPTLQFQTLCELCKAVGLWIVPVGELEGFCRTVGGHGGKWVQAVLERGGLGREPDLERAREFVRELWEAGTD